ncbi:hypothetical protein [Paenibacillus sp. IHBB 3054]|uniref:hypothetical protein n=1 Tax=Paenibacillus sp. IHBB 3054 TaxID=3425689 RepID=UPI003F6796FB
MPETDGPCVVYMDFRPGNILINDNKVMMPSVRLPGVKKKGYILNLKLEIRERSNGGGFWNWRSGSVRLKAFRRKTSIESISSLRISTAKSGIDQEILTTTAAGSPNIHRNCD